MEKVMGLSYINFKEKFPQFHKEMNQFLLTTPGLNSYGMNLPVYCPCQLVLVVHQRLYLICTP
ncbi:conserved hypothetical protein [Ricinus communis]|uniref:Uncharacterized protein n=1 Tax=Ricinus communis TaxID=3988 RepID=B9T4P1_RICCO|nr:conserved hypothetical protein [Ricinus communis]